MLGVQQTIPKIFKRTPKLLANKQVLPKRLFCEALNCIAYYITYGPRKAVAEVSNHNEPIGRKSGIQMVRKSMDFTFTCFVLS